ncbi:MAG TPA: transglycosylase domain-containing protein [Arthrobacter sp.]|nr:transglycosylase domain-containing protein [Arthrobacter sp.]
MALKNEPKTSLSRVMLRIFGFLVTSTVCGVLAASLVAPAVASVGFAVSGSVQYFDALPSQLDITPLQQATTVLSSDGKTIATFYDENRVKVSLDQMSPYIKNGIVAIEDSRFYQHGGVDPRGIIRALLSDLSGGAKEGASTITQQYVANVLNETLLAAGQGNEVVLNGQKTLGDKVREMKLAVELEKRYTKDQILEGYLNIVFFNRDAYGIEAAAQHYFSVSAKDLSLPQAALLAGLVNSPSYYDPTVYPDHAIQRRNLVLSEMLKQGMIQQAQYAAAVATPVQLKISAGGQGCGSAEMAPYFCDYISHLILNNPAYGATPADRENLLYRGGLTITTTLDSRLQGAAQTQVDATAGANPDKWGASLVTIQPGTGRILAMAQNTVWLPTPGKFDSQLNFNVDAKDANGNDLNGDGGFQPGSTMKPFTFTEWLNEGKSPTQVVDASKQVYPLGFPWRASCGKVLGAYDSAEKSLGAADDLRNNDAGYYRPMPVNYGLYNSINTATFAEATQLDFCGIQHVVDAVGLHSGVDGSPVNMLQLGNLLGGTEVSPLVLADAFATYANDGSYCAPIALLSVTTPSGAKLPAQAASCRAAVKPEVARGVTSVLQDVLKKGSGVYIQPKVQDLFPTAAKTGTSNTNGATWVVGYTTGLATASFFGDTSAGQSRPGQNVTINGKFYPALDGYMLAGPQWANYMSQVGRLYPAGAFPAPPAPPSPSPSPSPSH